MDFKELLSVALILFSIIDILGSLPIIISLKEKGAKIRSVQATLVSGVLMIGFLYVGEGILSLFHVDINSFAVAGGIVIFLMGMEMILGVSFFKENDTNSSVSIFPIAFPLIAGAGTLTTILTLKSEYDSMNIIGGIVLNLILVFLVLRFSGRITKIIGTQGVNVLRKVFGIILLAIAVKLIKENLLIM